MSGKQAARAVALSFEALATVGGWLPQARPERHGLRRERDLAYGPLPAHRLDLYRPVSPEGPLPLVLYVHGGGFRALSKDTHWLMGLAFGRRGYAVASLDYRLAPEHPFPAALEDVGLALEWLAAKGPDLGLDLGRLVIAGESAGANLALALTICACQRREEPYARRVFDLGLRPAACLPAAGILQVSDTARFRRRKPSLPGLLAAVIENVEHCYLTGTDPAHGRALGDPLLIVEQVEEWHRPLPPMYLCVGTADPILDDTRRLSAALSRQGVRHQASYFPGELHAFHALLWRAAARRCWAEMLTFTEEALTPYSTTESTGVSL